jgi:hypothetical protein
MWLHWINVEYWASSWPNIFAPSIWTLPAVIIAHVRAYRQRERHHAEMKQHVTDTHRGGGGHDG